MAVEINILSGKRQGERIVLDGSKIRAGTEATCDIYFDPSADSSVRDRAAVLNLLDDGWYIQSTGQGQVFVDQSPVVGLTRLKSGAVVRMSEFGPEFEFRIVGSPLAAVGEPRVNPLSVRRPIPYGPPVTGEPSSLARGSPAPAAVSPAFRKPRDMGRLAVMAGLAVVVLLMVLVLVKLSSPPAVVILPGPAQAPGPNPSWKADTAPQTAMGIAPEKPESTSVLPSSVAAKPGAPATDPLLARCSGSVLLIQVEKAGHSWPFAACCAIAENVALTSARESLQLGVWLKDTRSGFKGWVTEPGTGLKLPIQTTRIYAVRISSPEQQKPNDWLYTNLGLVIVEGVFSKTVELAGPDDLTQLAPGKPVHAACYPHEGDLITPEDRLELKTVSGKILFINAHPELPGKPRVLGVKADLPKFPQGSPLLNPQGRVVAVYSAPVAELDKQPQGGAGLENIHYATVIHPGVIDLWLKRSDSAAWVSTAELELPSNGRGPHAEKPR